jgi:hypothetical protein
LPPLTRCLAGAPDECVGEVALIREPAFERDLGDGHSGMGKKYHCAQHALADEPAIGRNTHGAGECPNEIAHR